MNSYSAECSTKMDTEDIDEKEAVDKFLDRDQVGMKNRKLTQRNMKEDSRLFLSRAKVDSFKFLSNSLSNPNIQRGMENQISDIEEDNSIRELGIKDNSVTKQSNMSQAQKEEATIQKSSKLKKLML